MKLIKNGIIKDIPKNLVSEYLSMGWKEYKPIKETPKKESIFITKPNKDKDYE